MDYFVVSSGTRMKLSIVLLLCTSALAHPTQKHGRIINGELARSGQFPFSAAIYITTSDARYFCGGAILSNQWILTAAHCIDGFVSFTIHLGTTKMSGGDANSVTVSTSAGYPHPDYDPISLANDIALIKLRLPITFSQYIGKINLPTARLQDNVAVTTIGWGQTADQNSGFVDDLNYVVLASISDEECRRVYGNQILETMVCADGNYNQGICMGDTGGPLIEYQTVGNTPVQVGIGSFVSVEGCEKTQPSGFTRVFPYISWIEDTMAN